MPYFFYYLLKVIICSAVLFGYYHLFLRNKVYHAYNRFYLLAITVVSLVVPFINFNVLFSNDRSSSTPVQLLQVMNSSDEYLEEVIIRSHNNYLSSSQWMMLGYVLISIILLFGLVKVWMHIYRIIRNSANQPVNDIVFVESDAKGTPFSFFSFIFWNNAIDINSTNGKRILTHEIAHVREKHSYDKLYINLLLILFWINPVFWLIKKELTLIHEFIADKKAIADHDAGALAAMIIQSAYPHHSYLMSNHFFYSPIKRRLKMLTKYNNKKASYFYRILALPVMLFLTAAFTIKAKSGIEEILNPSKKITVVIDAGHGGTDGGALGADRKTYEKEVNLALIKKIKELNTASNIELVFTRETDIYQNPKEKANVASAADADLFISVHVASSNAVNGTLSGMEVFVSRDNFENSASSKLFASAIIQQFKSNYSLAVANNPIQRSGGIHVLQALNCPSVLIEAGYINNSKDLKYLQTNEGQTVFAKNILAAIAQFAAAEKNQNNAVFVTDTLPKNKTIGTYKGQPVTNIEVEKKELIHLTLSDGKTITVTPEDAKKGGVQVPASTPALGEVVVVGYGTKKASEVPLKTDANQEVVVEGFPIQGKVSEVKIRGQQVPEGIQPTYYLEGVEISSDELRSINPNTIKSINVLKGASAAEKHGAEKSINGVIEIQLKNPKDEKAQRVIDSSVVNLKLAPIKEEVIVTGHPKVFTQVEEEAAFPGGVEAWKKYLMKNLDAAVAVNEGWAAGVFKVIVQFTVNKDGSIVNVSTVNYQGSKTAQECINLISQGPKWIPAKQNGRIVASIRKQPITFVIEEEDAKPVAPAITKN